MASDPILFDSEEFDSQDKENKINNDLISPSSNGKQVDQQNAEPIQEDSLNKLLDLEARSKDNANDDLTQSSQDILDSIVSNIKNASNKELSSNSSNLIPESDRNSDLPDSLLETDNGNELDSEQMNLSEPMEDSTTLEAESSVLADDTQVAKKDDMVATTNTKLSSEKHCTLPLSRVKLIMKTDPNVKVVSSEATVLAAIAAVSTYLFELFHIFHFSMSYLFIF